MTDTCEGIGSLYNFKDLPADPVIGTKRFVKLGCTTDRPRQCHKHVPQPPLEVLKGSHGINIYGGVLDDRTHDLILEEEALRSKEIII